MLCYVLLPECVLKVFENFEQNRNIPMKFLTQKRKKIYKLFGNFLLDIKNKARTIKFNTLTATGSYKSQRQELQLNVVDIRDISIGMRRWLPRLYRH